MRVGNTSQVKVHQKTAKISCRETMYKDQSTVPKVRLKVGSEIKYLRPDEDEIGTKAGQGQEG